uniref:Uncharacterized protein n=1 Tax=Solanum lycopersicum TaxID=4081 RepID=A0A3Q7HL23_SOLLC
MLISSWEATVSNNSNLIPYKCGGLVRLLRAFFSMFLLSVHNPFGVINLYLNYHCGQLTPIL